MQAQSLVCLTETISTDCPWWNTVNKRHNPSDKDALDFDALFSDESAPIRADLVARVRRQIAEGSYDVPRRWEKALDRLYKELQPE